MKETRPYVVIILASILATLISPGLALAQRRDTNVNPDGQTYFASAESCVAAISDGTAKYYRPTFFKLHKAVAAGEELRGLESDACVMMLTVKGYRWVAQKEGEQMVFRGLNIVRRYDCGNPIKDIRYPKTDEPEPKPTPKPTPFRCPEGTEPGEQPGVCIQIVEKERVVEKEKIVDNTCKPTAIRELLSYHEEKKGFIPSEIIRERFPDQAGQFLALLGGAEERATSLIIMTDGCNVGVKTRNVIRKGDKWKWLWIGLAAGGGFAAGYFLRPGCKKCKTTTKEPIKSTPRSGSPVPIRPRIIPR